MYQNLMNLCVSAGNLEAHYLRGMQEYFQKENIADGLAHLQITAQEEIRQSENHYWIHLDGEKTKHDPTLAGKASKHLSME
ncbi:unnamed protein product [Brassica oleracea var. botrytis]